MEAAMRVCSCQESGCGQKVYRDQSGVKRMGVPLSDLTAPGPHPHLTPLHHIAGTVPPPATPRTSRFTNQPLHSPPSSPNQTRAPASPRSAGNVAPGQYVSIVQHTGLLNRSYVDRSKPCSSLFNISSRAMPLHSSLGQEGTANPTSFRRSQATPSTPVGLARSQRFRSADFENICNYLESPHHYNELFANGAHTTFGVGNQSKSTSFDTFADWMNELNPDLKLTRRGLSLRLTSYKRAYTKAKDYEHLTHEGGDEGHGKEILEQICPCFERLDRIFNNQADMTPIMPGDQALRPNPIITGTNGLAGHTVLTLAMLVVVYSYGGPPAPFLSCPSYLTDCAAHLRCVGCDMWRQENLWAHESDRGLNIVMRGSDNHKLHVLVSDYCSSTTRFCATAGSRRHEKLVRKIGAGLHKKNVTGPRSHFDKRKIWLAGSQTSSTTCNHLQPPGLWELTSFGERAGLLRWLSKRPKLQAALREPTPFGTYTRFTQIAMDNGSQIDPSLSQTPSALSSAEHPLPSGQLQSTATASNRNPSPSNPKTGKKRAQGKGGARTKQPALLVTRLQLAKSKRDHQQAIRDMMKDQDDPPPKKVTRARMAKSGKASPNEDGGKHFVRNDFENICTYLETDQHFTDLFGDGSKTTISATKQSKVKAFNVFAVWMNQHNAGLQLNGQQIHSAKHRQDGTGGGVEEEDGAKPLAEILDEMCPCFERINAIFREKANMTPMFEFDHSMIDATVDVDDSDISSEEIFLDGWEPTQTPADPRAHSLAGAGTTPITDLDGDTDDFNSTLPDLADLFGSSGAGMSPITPAAGRSPSRGPPPPHPTSAPATMLNLPGPPAPGSPMPHLAMVRQLSRGSRGGAPDPNARGTNAPDPKSKMSLANSFAQANERKFDILNKQIATEARRWEEAESRAERERDREVSKQKAENALMEKRLNLEEARIRQQDDLEQAKAAAALAKEDTLRNEKKAMVNEMLQAGRSSTEIAALVRLVFN
ncbi:hypothetical protein PSTT_03269 [Puccinia striiformis]|uniref:Uncharacterized protein n=1 Tax=Puccinia striiformis TaxID=27350 RepID=A0A2S4VWZ6_9BASI|nr:hypothetical protein PSTT_03269 [Puccinia striiformis]